MIKGQASSETINKILDRLSSDSDFREQLVGDPKTALAQYGLQVDESKLPVSRTLPSKDAIKSSQKELSAKIQNNAGLILFIPV